MSMPFYNEVKEGGIEITIRCSEKDYEILKYAAENGYEQGSYEVETVIRSLLHYELMTLELHSGEVEKFRWQLMLEGKDPNIDLRKTNPDLFVKSGGTVKDRKIPHYKPRLPALLTIKR